MTERIEAAGHRTGLIDPRTYGLSATASAGSAAATASYAEMVGKADALVIVSPEYNHGYPGELKMLLDLAYAEYAGKPVGICGVSDGHWGGARCVEQLRQVVVALGMYPVQRAVYFRDVKELFSEGLMAAGLRDSYEKSADGLIAQVAAYAATLKDSSAAR